MVVIAFDTSPLGIAMAIRTSPQEKWHVYSFSNKKQTRKHAQVHFSPLDTGGFRQAERTNIINRLHRVVLSRVSANQRRSAVIGLEKSLPFQVTSTTRHFMDQWNKDLHHYFMQHHWSVPIEKSPKVIKNHWTKKDNANKTEMFHGFRKNEPNVALHQLFGLDPAVRGTHYMHPISDIVDAVALLYYLEGRPSRYEAPPEPLWSFSHIPLSPVPAVTQRVRLSAELKQLFDEDEWDRARAVLSNGKPRDDTMAQVLHLLPDDFNRNDMYYMGLNDVVIEESILEDIYRFLQDRHRAWAYWFYQDHEKEAESQMLLAESLQVLAEHGFRGFAAHASPTDVVQFRNYLVWRLNEYARTEIGPKMNQVEHFRRRPEWFVWGEELRCWIDLALRVFNIPHRTQVSRGLTAGPNAPHAYISKLVMRETRWHRIWSLDKVALGKVHQPISVPIDENLSAIMFFYYHICRPPDVPIWNHQWNPGVGRFFVNHDGSQWRHLTPDVKLFCRTKLKIEPDVLEPDGYFLHRFRSYSLVTFGVQDNIMFQSSLLNQMSVVMRHTTTIMNRNYLRWNDWKRANIGAHHYGMNYPVRHADLTQQLGGIQLHPERPWMLPNTVKEQWQQWMLEYRSDLHVDLEEHDKDEQKYERLLKYGTSLKDKTFVSMGYDHKPKQKQAAKKGEGRLVAIRTAGGTWELQDDEKTWKQTHDMNLDAPLQDIEVRLAQGGSWEPMVHLPRWKLELRQDRQAADEEDEDYEEVYEVEDIVEKKVERGTTFYKVKWKHYDTSENTWESGEKLLTMVPKLVNRFETRK